jgi:maltodextrin utilization protein YvdJ
MFLYRYFKHGFDYPNVFKKLIPINIKVILYFVILTFLTAFPLNYQIIREEGFRLDFIAESFQQSFPSNTIDCEISFAGIVCEDDVMFQHEGVTYYVETYDSNKTYDSQSVILSDDNIYYLQDDNILESRGYQGFSDTIDMGNLIFSNDTEKAALWQAFGEGIEASFGSYIIFNALLTNTVIQFVIQFIFIIFLSFVIQLFKYQLSSFMTYQESLTFIIWMMTLPAVLSVVIAFIEPVFASVIYQFMVGIVIMIVMLKYGRKYYK